MATTATMARQQGNGKGRNASLKALEFSFSSAPQDQPFAGMALAVLGVVYGDIRTSPICALQQCFVGPGSLTATTDNVLGILSLIFWTLVLIISLKYMGLWRGGQFDRGDHDDSGVQPSPANAAAGACPRR